MMRTMISMKHKQFAAAVFDMCRPLSWLAILSSVAFAAPRSGLAAPSEEKSEADPKALKALARSTAYLRSLPAFSVQAYVTRDEVIYSGYKLERSSNVRMSVKRPDRLRAEVSGDQGARLFVYDGKYLSVFLKDENYFGSILAPATLLGTLESIERHGIELPLLDLVYIAMGGQLEPNITDAGFIGLSNIDGVSCAQLAFRGHAVDWQLWIEQGDKPLLRKLVITTTDDPARPQYSAVFHWDLTTPIVETDFAFAPPKNVSRLTFGSGERRSAELSPPGDRASP
jgi:hypothetical protein